MTIRIKPQLLKFIFIILLGFIITLFAPVVRSQITKSIYNTRLTSLNSSVERRLTPPNRVGEKRQTLEYFFDLGKVEQKYLLPSPLGKGGHISLLPSPLGKIEHISLLPSPLSKVGHISLLPSPLGKGGQRGVGWFFIASKEGNPETLIQQGITAYQNEQFLAAITFWQQAVNSFTSQGDYLNRGLVLSNISLAYQHLGQLQAAQETINQSLKLIESLESNSSPVNAAIKAKVWNTQARLFWQESQLQEALKAWEKATYEYTIAANPEGIIGTQLNQVKVLQILGLSLRAKEMLNTIKQNLKLIENNELKADVLHQLGLNLRQIGDLSRSQEVLQQGLVLTKEPNTKTSLLLELGHIERALEQQNLSIGKLQQAQIHSQAALEFYQQAAQIGSEGQLLPLLNQLSLLVENGQWESGLKLLSSLKERISQLSPSRESIYAHLNLAQNIACLKRSIEQKDFNCINSAHREQLLKNKSLFKVNLTTPSWDTIAQIIAAAISQAQQLDDSLIQSLAVGQMGELYEITGQWSEAQKLTEQALLLLEEIKAPELRYRWEWQLGRLLNKQGNITEAISSYKSAVNSLKAVRGDLLSVDAEIQFSFRDQVEPVYREFVNLLLTSKENVTPSQENLQQAIEEIDSLQIAELENFLGCDLRAEISVQENLAKIDPNAAFIYPIILPERLAVIVKFSGKPLTFHQFYVPQTVVKTAITNLRISILRRNAGQVIANAQSIYQWILEPLEKALQDNPAVQTLVFVLDGELRNIPLGVLYDGKKQQYLIEKDFDFVVLPSSRLFNVNFKNKNNNWQVLGAGISQEIEVENRYFSPLEVTKELQEIQKTLGGKILLDTQFTASNVENNLNKNKYSIVHLATHGNFSSDPQETFILAYSDNIPAAGILLRPNDIDILLRPSEEDLSKTINLLVLSACQTALGDNRATLGLAGLAVKSGADATLASLWQISDDSTVQLMNTFYNKLSQPGVSKARALHLAQKTLLQEQKYQNTYYWAAYVLVGNWH